MTESVVVCTGWDWWGFTGVEYASKLGAQMVAIHRMAKRLVSTRDIRQL